MPLLLVHGYPSSFVEFAGHRGRARRAPRRRRRGRTGAGVPRRRTVDPGLRVLDAAHESRLGHRADGPCVRRDHAGARLRPLRRVRRGRRRRNQRTAVPRRRRPCARLHRRDRPRIDRDPVHAAHRPPHRRGARAPRATEGRAHRGLRLPRPADDPSAQRRLRPHRLPRRPGDLDRGEVPGVDRPRAARCPRMPSSSTRCSR